jgi:hypothetical protein
MPRVHRSLGNVRGARMIAVYWYEPVPRIVADRACRCGAPSAGYVYRYRLHAPLLGDVVHNRVVTGHTYTCRVCADDLMLFKALA